MFFLHDGTARRFLHCTSNSRTEYLVYPLFQFRGTFNILVGSHSSSRLYTLICSIISICVRVRITYASKQTWCVVMGFKDCFSSSCIVLWSCLKSVLQPTKSTGKPGQYRLTSGIHCTTQSYRQCVAFCDEEGSVMCLPFLIYSPMIQEYPLKMQSKQHLNQGMIMFSVYRSPLVLLYPITLLLLVLNQQRHL